MRKKWWIIPAAIIGIPLFIFVGGEVVMHLWNWVLPSLFGWRLVAFWSGCRAAGSLPGSLRRPRSRRGPVRMAAAPPKNWDRMTPEEREKFRPGMRARCGGFGKVAGSTDTPA